MACAEVGVEAGEGLASEGVDFEGADDAFEVVGVDALGGEGVELGEAVVEGVVALCGGLLLELAAYLGVGRWALEEALY